MIAVVVVRAVIPVRAVMTRKSEQKKMPNRSGKFKTSALLFCLFFFMRHRKKKRQRLQRKQKPRQQRLQRKQKSRLPRMRRKRT